MTRDTSQRDANRDPITGTPGAHPVGVGVGGVAGGLAAPDVKALARQSDLAVESGSGLGAQHGVWDRQVVGLVGRSGVQRSISPNTMSMVPITATASAIMWPRDISSIAARWAKPGARIFRR
mgnify:CR=1 FL=1